MLAPDFAARWQRIRRRADAFAPCAARLGLETSWGEGNPFDAAEPPASEGDMRAVERAVGFELPLSLRQFFLEGSAALEFAWSLPRREAVTRRGLPDTVYALVPPPPFQVDRGLERGLDRGARAPAQRIAPRITGGCVSIALAHVAPLCRQARQRADGFAEQARAAGDEAMRLHLQGFAEAWRRGVPFAGVGNGDLIAVDAADPAEAVVCVNHDGADCPVYALGRPLLDHLDVSSRLGFVWHDRLFADADACRALEARAEAEHPYEASLGLRRVEAGVMGAGGPEAAAWRTWLGWPED